MQKDFHYGVIKILALHSGFNEPEAETLAYSSQYVDDAVLHRPFIIDGKIYMDHPRFDGKYFDPVCTAHKGIQFIEDFKLSVQEKIYLSFHFLPEEPYKGSGKYCYEVMPNSEMGQILVYWAMAKLKSDYTLENLIRLGVALHSFADTWAHQRFSGTHNHRANDIHHIEIWDGKHWKAIKPYRQFFYNFFPDIGHAEAYDFPDLPFLKWRYIRARTNEFIVRDNTSIFLEAAEVIFKILCNIKNCNSNWRDIENKLIKALATHRNSKEIFGPLAAHFPNVTLKYSSLDWLEKAIKFKRIRRFPHLIGQVRDDRKWFIFHKVAYEQRKFVLDKIKSLRNRNI